MQKEIFGIRIVSNNGSNKYGSVIQSKMNQVNAKRGFFILLLGVILEPLLIIFYDIPNLMDNGWFADYAIYYLLLHGFILLISIFGVFQTNYYMREQRFLWFKSMDFQLFSIIVVIVFLSAVAMINGLDQRHGDSITIYSFYLILVGVLILIKPRYMAIIMFVPHMVFLLGMVLFQSDRTLMINNMTNGTIAITCSFIISFVFYNNFYDITEKTILLEKTTDQLEILSNIDPLTSTYNRRYFYDFFKQSSANPVGIRRISLLLFDLDSFKKINDTYGHIVGDEMLVIFAQIMKHQCDKGELTVRWGGEEFLMLLVNRNDDNIKAIIEVIQKECLECFSKTLDRQIQMTVSVGIASNETFDHREMDLLLSRVDKALYYAKNSGKNQAIFHAE